MKEFNIEEAKAGKAVCTRDGRAARIICWDMKGTNPIVALIEDENWNEIVIRYNKNGQTSYPSYDLMMVTNKKKGWINLYKGIDSINTSELVYSTREEALSKRRKLDYLTTIKIEWEE